MILLMNPFTDLQFSDGPMSRGLYSIYKYIILVLLKAAMPPAQVTLSVTKENKKVAPLMNIWCYIC